MHFDLIDAVSHRTQSSIRAVKNVSLAEEYLQDHFPDYPVLPGVFMIETMVQAARKLIAGRPEGAALPPMVLGEAKAVRFGAFVKPGQSLRVDVELIDGGPDPHSGAYRFKGTGVVVRAETDENEGADAAETAVSGRFTLRPLRRR